MIMNSRVGFAPLLCVAFLVVAGCDLPTDGRGSMGPALSIPGVDSRLAHGYTGFGFDIFRTLAEEEPHENVFVSGTSIAFALAMVYHGMEGETRREVARMLGVDGVDIETFHASNRAWLAALLDGAGDVELAIANSVWARLGFPFHQAFLERNQIDYRAHLEAVNFDDPATVDRINDWVAEQTGGRIDEVVKEIDPWDIMFLINALYFLAEWTEPFPEDGTAWRWFYPPGAGEPRSVPMMQRRDTLEYHAGDGARTVRLPYGEDGRYAMYIVLPDSDLELSSIYRGLSAGEWARRIDRLRPTELELRMPRFTLEYEADLIPTLESLGMLCAFVPRCADLSALTPVGEEVYISEVLHKTFVDVNETGTEAAAVTSIRITRVSGPSNPVMIVNRPFFVVIQDDVTGTVLFTGQVTNP